MIPFGFADPSELTDPRLPQITSGIFHTASGYACRCGARTNVLGDGHDLNCLMGFSLNRQPADLVVVAQMIGGSA